MSTYKNIDGVLLSPLKNIETKGGDVLQGMKADENGYFGFGEAYFSTVTFKSIKGWKRHKRMILNIIVPIGAIRFVIYDDRKNSISNNTFQEIILSRKNYQRLTIPPMVWVAFQGLGSNENILLNIANIIHDINEVDNLFINNIDYKWEH